MRWPRMRFTVRRMMIAIAIIGVVTALEATRQRREFFRSRARDHAGELQGIADESAPWIATYWERYWYPKSGEPRKTPKPSAVERQAYEENRKRRIAYHEALYWKYQSAASRPWLPVESDPPAPPEP